MGVVTHTFRFSGLGEDFGPRKGSGLVILHTTEGSATAISVDDAIALARWQDRDDTAGSYNRLIASDGCVSTVPDQNASGGVNPFSPYFKPLPWLYEKLPTAKVNDPNSYGLQLSFMGRKAHFDTNGWPPAMIDRAARSILEEEARIGARCVVANHADFQPGNRTDAGPLAMKLVLERYRQLTEDALPALRPVRQQWTTGVGPGVAVDASVPPKGEFWTLGPEQGDQKHFLASEKVWTIAESVDGSWRVVEYGTEILFMHRNNIRPIAGTRNPASGFGAPVLTTTGYTLTQLNAAKQTTADKANASMDAWTATRPEIKP